MNSKNVNIVYSESEPSAEDVWCHKVNGEVVYQVWSSTGWTTVATNSLDARFETLDDRIDNIPTQVQADWNQNDNEATDYIKHKPTIPSAQIQADWNQNDSTSVDYVKNRICYESIIKIGETSSEVTSDNDVGKFAWSSVSIASLPNIGDKVIAEDSEGNIVGQSDVSSQFGGSIIINGVTGGWSISLQSGDTYVWTGSAIGQNLSVGDEYTVYIKSSVVTKQIEDKFIPDTIVRSSQLGGVQFKIEGSPAALMVSIDGGTTWQTVSVS